MGYLAPRKPWYMRLLTSFETYVGFVAGCFFTVGAAYVWSLYL